MSCCFEAGARGRRAGTGGRGPGARESRADCEDWGVYRLLDSALWLAVLAQLILPFPVHASRRAYRRTPRAQKLLHLLSLAPGPWPPAPAPAFA